MPNHEFHLFPRLPTEIRLEIWKHAVRPLSENIGGIQHFKVITENHKSKDYMLSGCRVGETQVRMSVKILKVGNRSAYLWDVGLLTASHESRAMFLKVTSFLKRQKPNQGAHFDGEWCACNDDAESRGPRSLVWQMRSLEKKTFYRPNQDLITLSFGKRNRALQNIQALQANVRTLVGGGDNNFGCDFHLGLEFDPTWFDKVNLANLQNHMYGIWGFLLRRNGRTAGKMWLIERASNLSLHNENVALEIEDCPDPSPLETMMSDRSEDEEATDSMVFRDLDMEYRPVVPFIHHYCCYGGRHSSASYF